MYRCNCIFDNLDNFKVHCNAIIRDNMHNALINKSKDELKQYCQHKLTENAFLNVSTGGWKYGVWGLCPSEILHQLYEGLITYALDYIFFKICLLMQVETNWKKTLQKSSNAAKINQIDHFQKLHIHQVYVLQLK